MRTKDNCYSVSLVTPFVHTMKEQAVLSLTIGTSTLKSNFTGRLHTCGQCRAYVIHSTGTWQMYTVLQTSAKGGWTRD